MSATRFARWKDRTLRLAHAGGASVVGALGGVIRNKWLALHLDTAGLGVLGQVFSFQTWLATATGAGLGLPVAQAVGAAIARGDTAAVRRTLSTALAVLATSALGVAVIGLALAPAISTALLGTAEHAGLVRISMIAMAGLSFQGTIQGLFAGYSDVRATFVYALLGNLAVVALVLLLVPRFGLAGAVWSMAAFWPVAILGTLALSRHTYTEAFAPAPAPRFDPAEGRSMLKVAAAALMLALLDQGTLLALRSHYVRIEGLDANGLLQSALALSQQLGAVFYGYLGGYAFGRISGAAGVDGIAAYTRRQFGPLVGIAALAFVVAAAAAGPLLHLLYSARFDAARPMVGVMMLGDFAKVALLTWALGALPLGGVRLWFPIGVSWPVGMVASYLAARAAGAHALSLPIAYGGAGLFSLTCAALMMSGRGVTLRGRDLAILAAGLAALGAVAWNAMRGVFT